MSKGVFRQKRWRFRWRFKSTEMKGTGNGKYVGKYKRLFFNTLITLKDSFLLSK